MFNNNIDEKKLKDNIDSYKQTLGNEINIKYLNKIGMLKEEIERIKQQYNLGIKDMLVNMQKVAGQCQAEKAGMQEQFDFIYNKYTEKKQQYKDLVKQLDKSKKHLDNQRKIYERLFTEGFKLDDVRKIMDRYMEKEAAKTQSSIDVKSKTSNTVVLHS